MYKFCFPLLSFLFEYQKRKYSNKKTKKFTNTNYSNEEEHKPRDLENNNQKTEKISESPCQRSSLVFAFPLTD
jgi:hypothetical protein